MGREFANRRRMLPERVWRDAVEHCAPRCRQHGGKQLHHEGRFQVYKPMLCQQARHHIGILGRIFGAERSQRAGGQSQIQANREDMPRTYTRAHSNHHAVLRLVGHNLIEQGQQGSAATVHDGASADLDDIDVGQNGGNLRFSPRQHPFIHQRFTHQV